METRQEKIGYYTFLAVFVLAISMIGNWLERHQSALIFVTFCSAFTGYVFLMQKKVKFEILLSSGILARLVLFFSLPTLSDDLYRFIWDGTLLANGIHPFEQLPGYYLDRKVGGITQELYTKLNSPDYFTIYPPINQWIFWLSVKIGNGSWLISANVIRTFLLAADIGSLFLLRSILRQNQRSVHLANWYFLNPLVILESVGNLHFEGLVIFFILLGIYGYQKNKNMISASGFGLAIGTKLLPLIYLPYVFLMGLKDEKWWISLVAGCIGLATLIPMLNSSFISGMSESLDLYFRSFEFNASLYFIARQIGIWIYSYNNIALIGPLLSVVSFITIVTISFIGSKKKWSLPKTCLFILTAYLLFATTVHPWYILPLVAFGLLAGYWYPVVWSFLIFLTYLGYREAGFELPLYLVVLEYVIVLTTLIIEIKNKPRSGNIELLQVDNSET